MGFIRVWIVLIKDFVGIKRSLYFLITNGFWLGTVLCAWHHRYDALIMLIVQLQFFKFLLVVKKIMNVNNNVTMYLSDDC